MTKQEFAALQRLIRELFPRVKARAANDDPAASTDSYSVRYPLFADLDFDAAAAVVYKLAATQRFEPAISEIRDAVLANSRPADTHADAWARLVEAVTIHRDIHAANDLPPVEFEMFPDGSARPIITHISRWRTAAGTRVAEWIDQTGGIFSAAENLNDHAYRAQFRDWWNIHQARDTQHAAMAEANQAYAVLKATAAPGTLAAQIAGPSRRELN